MESIATGICAIMKDCDQNYLEEWIDWHKLIGFDYFFIYDNGSKKPINETLIDYNNVIIYDFPGNIKQLPAYMDCITKQKNGEQIKCDWIAFIDEDEFIFVESGNIKDLLHSQQSSAIGLNWLMFGSNGLKEKTDGKQMRKFLKHNEYKAPVNKHIKSIVRPELVEGFNTPHDCRYISGNCCDVLGNVLNGPFTETPIHKIAWINHYYTRSEAEIQIKINKGRADCNIPRNMQQFHDFNAECTVESVEIIELYLRLTNL